MGCLWRSAQSAGRPRPEAYLVTLTLPGSWVTCAAAWASLEAAWRATRRELGRRLFVLPLRRGGRVPDAYRSQMLEALAYVRRWSPAHGLTVSERPARYPAVVVREMTRGKRRRWNPHIHLICDTPQTAAAYVAAWITATSKVSGCAGLVQLPRESGSATLAAAYVAKYASKGVDGTIVPKRKRLVSAVGGWRLGLTRVAHGARSAVEWAYQGFASVDGASAAVVAHPGAASATGLFEPGGVHPAAVAYARRSILVGGDRFARRRPFRLTERERSGGFDAPRGEVVYVDAFDDVLSDWIQDADVPTSPGPSRVPSTTVQRPSVGGCELPLAAAVARLGARARAARPWRDSVAGADTGFALHVRREAALSTLVAVHDPRIVAARVPLHEAAPLSVRATWLRAATEYALERGKRLTPRQESEIAGLAPRHATALPGGSISRWLALAQ